MRRYSSHISKSLALLKKQKKYYHSIGYGVILKDHIRSLKRGLELLEKILRVSSNDILKRRIQNLVFIVKWKLAFLAYNQRDGSVTIQKLDLTYAFLRRKMSNAIIQKGTNEYEAIFPYSLNNVWMGDFGHVNDFLLENIYKMMSSTHNTDHRVASLRTQFGELLENLTFLKPLFIHLAATREFFTSKKERKLLTPLVLLLDTAACVIYSSSVGIMDGETIHSLKTKFDDLDVELHSDGEMGPLYVPYMEKINLDSLLTSASGISKKKSAHLGSERYLLDSLMKLFDSNEKTVNDANCMLYEELRHLKISLSNLTENVRLRKCQYFQASVSVVCFKSLDILCTCYKAERQKNLVGELQCKLSDVLDRIQHIKCGIQEMEPTIFPQTDGFGFLEYFLEYLDYLLESQQISILHNEIHALYLEFYSLVSFLKMIQDKYNGSLWTSIVHLAYRAEYQIDLYLAYQYTLQDDSSLIPSLFDIMEKLNGIRKKVIMDYVVQGQKDMGVISVIEPSSTLSMDLYNDSSIAQRFDFRAWCTISQTYQKRDVLLNILGDVVAHTDDLGKLNNDELGKKLYITLQLRRYLIVLEDVWDFDLWNYIQKYLPNNQNYSRVLITTRDIQTGSKVHALHVKSLSPQNNVVKSWSHVLSPDTRTYDTVVGFKVEGEKIKEFLFGGPAELEVIAIVGMPGIGKTTLAMHMFNASLISHHFDIQARCTVSQIYQKKQFFLSILDQLTPDNNDYIELDDQEFGDKLCRILKQRRYLIVIDDIWDVNVWGDIKRYFPDNNQGSRILITTRYESVACGITTNVHALHGLTEDESWELLLKKFPQVESLTNNFQRVAKGITESCNGLPLSIVIIAGILARLEKTEQKWNQVAKKVTSYILADPQGKFRSILELSYNHLPGHLRSCFLYLAAFQEDAEVSISLLVRVWVAEGLVRDAESKSSEELAEEYLMDLISRNLVIPFSKNSLGGVKTCGLHDLLKDFCLEKSKEEHFLTMLDTRTLSDPSLNSHRLIFNCGLGNTAVNINGCIKFINHNLRSMFHLQSISGTELDWMIESFNLVLLKVLYLHHLDLVPENISHLVHLRYLVIRDILDDYWEIVDLLFSITQLRNLQVLIVKYKIDDSVKFIQIPESIWNMEKLRHLHIRGRALFDVASYRLQKSCLLENLRFLSKPILYHDSLQWLRKLPKLKQLKCRLIQSCDGSKHYPFGLEFLNQLTSLKVTFWDRYTPEVNRCYYCMPKLPQSLKTLTLKSSLLTSEYISEIGRTIPHLEALQLSFPRRPAYEKLQWSVQDEDFPRLKILKMKKLTFGKWTASENSFPCLEKLMLNRCFDLMEIPPCFEDILTLSLLSVKNCRPSLHDSVMEILKIQRDGQNMELKVELHP